MTDPTTEDLQVEQMGREAAEREQGRRASEDAERKAHERRADKAGYLRERLGDRARSERQDG